jgi:hypothetical protein
MTSPFVVTDTVSSIARTLLTQSGNALDACGIEGYPYRLVLPGRDAAWDKPGTLCVLLGKVNMGNIGVEEFMAAEPGSEALARNAATFSIELWNEIPGWDVNAISGFQPPPEIPTVTASLALMDAGWTIFAWLEQLQWKNELFPFKPVMIGPLEPQGPQGDFAGMSIAVQVELG